MKYIIILTAIVSVILYYGIVELLWQLKNPAVKQRFKRLVTGVLIAALLASQLDIMNLFMKTDAEMSYAAETENTEIITISDFTELPDEIREQTVPVGTTLDELMLPDTLEAVCVTLGVDTDADIDEGVDTDTDAGEGTDTDEDADTDAGEGTDTNEDVDTDAGEDTDTDADVDTEADTDTDTDTDTDIDASNDTDTNADTYTDTDVTPDNDMLGDIDDAEGDTEKVETFSVTMPEYQTEHIIEFKTLRADSLTIENITWQPVPEYDGDVEGEYIFTAVLPEGYVLTNGAITPQITVTVGETDNIALLSIGDVMPLADTHDHNDHNDISNWEPWDDATSLPSDAGNYYLTTDVTPTKATGLAVENTNITLCLNGHTINAYADTPIGSTITVRSGVVLNIYDCQDNGAVTSKNEYYALNTNSGGTANIFGGTFKSADDESRGIYVEGTVTIENATVSGIYAVGIADGGNVTINGGTFTSTFDKSITLGTYGAGSGIYIKEGGTATIENATVSGPCPVYILSNGTATINGGKFECTQPLSITIYGDTGSVTTINDGEFINEYSGNVIQNRGTLVMSGGTVIGKSTDTSGVSGIVNTINQDNPAPATATINNVTVTTNGTVTDYGLRNTNGATMIVENCNVTSTFNGVLNTNSSKIEIKGGTFQGQYGIHNENGTFELSGSPTFTGSIADIYLSDDQKITVTGALGNTAPYSVLTKTTPTEGSPVEITDSGNTSLNDTTKFTAADSNYAMRKNSDGQLELAASEHTHDDIIFEPWTYTDRLPPYAGNYYLTSDVTLSSWWSPSANITLCLNGHTITYDGTPIQVNSGRTLGIYDCQGKGAVVTDKGYCIGIYSGGTANIYGGTFNGSSNDPLSATIYVEGTVTIENASVFSSNLRAIFNNGMATINGGTFESTATGYPTIQLQSGSTTIITGGKFIRNTGSNVIQNQGTLVMSGGTVTGSGSSNGAVGIVNSGTSATATIKDVTITTTEGTSTDDNTKADKGLRNDNGGTMIVENCNISSDNWAVWNTGISKIEISGGTFNGRYGMYNNSGTFELSGSPTFAGSTADIYLSSGQKITVAGTLGNAAPYSVLTETAPTVGSPVVITNSSNTNNNNVSKFTSVDGYTVRKNSNGQLELALLATYTITYDKGTPSNVTGSHNADIVAEGESVTLPGAVFTRTGYSQTGWSIESDGSTNDYGLNATFTPDSSITLYPYWTANQYTVSFNSAGGSSVSNITVTFDGTYGELTTPTRTGYKFDGWYTAETGGTKVESDTKVTIADNHTLYAKWTANEYDINYMDQGGAAFSGTHASGHPTKHTYGTATPLASASKTGYTFGGWYTNSSCTGSAVTSLGATGYTSDITLYAKWVANEYNITYMDQGGVAFSGTHASGHPTKHTYGTATTLKSASRTGYTFGGWYTDSSCTNRVTSLGATAYTSGITLYAKWTANEYSITYKDQGGAAFSGTHESGHPTKHTYGTATTLKSASKTGFTFSGWYTNSSCTGSAVTSLGATGYTSDITLYAKWTGPEYDITYMDQGGEAFSGTHESGYPTKHAYGTATTLKSASKTGYTFGGWYTDSSCTNKVTSLGATDYTSDVTLYAKWTKGTTPPKTDGGSSSGGGGSTGGSGGGSSSESGDGSQSSDNNSGGSSSEDTPSDSVTPPTATTPPKTDTVETKTPDTDSNKKQKEPSGQKTDHETDTASPVETKPVTEPQKEQTKDTQTDTTALTVGEGTVRVTVVSDGYQYAAGVTDTEAVADAVLTPEQIQLVSGGESIEIRVEVTDISDQVSQQDRNIIERGLADHKITGDTDGEGELTLGAYIDISMYIRIGDGDWDAITKAGEPIEVVIGIPDDLLSDERTYYIARCHEGDFALLNDLDSEPDTITIKTELFSTYAIVYRQPEAAGSRCGLCHICPTFLGICYFIWLAVIMVVMGVIIYMILRKQRREENAAR